MMPKAITVRLALAVALSLGLAAGAAAHDGAHHAHPAPGAAAASTSIAGAEPLVLPDLPVTDADGQSGGLRSRLPQTAPVIVSFTYTGCTSLCDVTNAILLGVEDALDEAGDADTRIVTLTIDPANDTPERLSEARRELGSGPRWLWLTGGVSGTGAILDRLGVSLGAIETHDPMFLVGRTCLGRFVRVVGLPDPDALAALAADMPPCEG
jgi:protein SCO1